MARSDAEVVSQLPVFRAKKSEDYPSWLIITCPRKDCEGTFLVHRRWLRPLKRTTRNTGAEYTIVGRPCTYCFRAGRLPARSSIR
jgi:hypothetical protein